MGKTKHPRNIPGCLRDSALLRLSRGLWVVFFTDQPRAVIFPSPSVVTFPLPLMFAGLHGAGERSGHAFSFDCCRAIKTGIRHSGSNNGFRSLSFHRHLCVLGNRESPASGDFEGSFSFKLYRTKARACDAAATLVHLCSPAAMVRVGRRRARTPSVAMLFFNIGAVLTINCDRTIGSLKYCRGRVTEMNFSLLYSNLDNRSGEIAWILRCACRARASRYVPSGGARRNASAQGYGYIGESVCFISPSIINMFG